MPPPGPTSNFPCTPPDQRRFSESKSAFTPARRPNGLVCCPPPSCHFLALCTGGLSNLFREISTNNQPPLHDFGAFTTEIGRFKPVLDMPLLALRYRFVKIIAEGQSCVVVEALDTFRRNNRVSVKILHLNYCKLGTQEVDMIRQLNQADPYWFSGVLRLQNTFMFDDHFCMVFHCYDPRTLLEHMKTIPDRDRLEFIRKVAARLVVSLGFLQSQNVIHADLKIENILLAEPSDPNCVRLVDFGNAIHCVHNEMSLYYQDFELQTLLYRAPEVMYGLPFGTEVDLWSLGMVLAQLYIGRPFVVGKCKQAVTADIVKTLGPLPRTIFRRGKFYRTLEQFTQDGQQADPVYRLMTKLRSTDYHFCDFLAGLLQYDPKRRITPAQAARHPFLAPILGFGHLSYGYSTIPLSSQSYSFSPLIHDEIKRQHLSTLDLLREGTCVQPKVTIPQTPVVKAATSQPIDLKHDRLELLRNRKRKASGGFVANEKPVVAGKSKTVKGLDIASTSYSEIAVEDMSSVSNATRASSYEWSSAQGHSTLKSPEWSVVQKTPPFKRESFVSVHNAKTKIPVASKKRDENFNWKIRPSPSVDRNGPSRSVKASSVDETSIVAPVIITERQETGKCNIKRTDAMALSSSSKNDVREEDQGSQRADQVADVSDEDSDDTALISSRSSKASSMQHFVERQRTPASSVHSGPAWGQPGSRDHKPVKPCTPSAGFVQKSESMLSGIVKSTPLLNSRGQQKKTLYSHVPNFGNISPIGAQVKTEMLKTRCKKSLSFNQNTKSDSRTPKRRRHCGTYRDGIIRKKRIGDKTQLIYDVFGDDV